MKILGRSRKSRRIAAVRQSSVPKNINLLGKLSSLDRVVTRGKLSQWLYWEKNLLERSTGRILDVSVNANSFCVQCSVMASAAFTRDRVLHYLPHQVKFYSLIFHVIAFVNAINCYIILKGVFLPNTWASQQHKYLKHGRREPVANKKMTLGQVVPNFTGQVVSSKILRIFRWKLWVGESRQPWAIFQFAFFFWQSREPRIKKQIY